MSLRERRSQSLSLPSELVVISSRPVGSYETLITAPFWPPSGGAALRPSAAFQKSTLPEIPPVAIVRPSGEKRIVKIAAPDGTVRSRWRRSTFQIRTSPSSPALVSAFRPH